MQETNQSNSVALDDQVGRRGQVFGPARDEESKLLQYWYSLWLTGAMGLAGTPVEMILGYRAVGFLFLCGILFLGLFYSFGPVLFAAALCGVIWDFFFIPPTFTLKVGSGEDGLLIVALILSALITGLLTRQIRRNQNELEARERATKFLYDLGPAFSNGSKEKNVVAAETILARAFGCDFMILAADAWGKLGTTARTQYYFRLWDSDREVAEKSLRSKRTATTTNDLGVPQLFFLPLLGSQDAFGVLACRLAGTKVAEGKERELLENAARLLGMALEREFLERKSREADRLRESEHLHQALLNSVSHEIRTPLTALLGSAAALQDEATARDPLRRQALLEEVSEAGERLNRVIENLLDMARLSTGVLALKKEWQDPAELARLTVGRLKSPLAKHRLKLDLPEGLPLIQVDYRLIEHALSNLLLNAAAYAPQGSEITLAVQVVGETLIFSVSDQGPGIPLDSLPRLFERFYRVPGSPAGGTGLGLFIAQSLLQAHGGDAQAENTLGGGAKFSLSLPLQTQPLGPVEPV